MSFPRHELEQSAQRPPLKALGSLLLFVVFCLLVWLYVYAYTTDVAGPISPIGVNIRVANDAGDRLYMLALQPIARMVPATQRRSWTWKTFYYVEIWCTDATTMTPVWRRRVLKLQPNNPGERDLIGVQGDVLWVYESGTLYGRALADGAVVSDTAAIEAKNPQLAGLMPRERRYFGFDGRGLYFFTADARHYRIDAETLEARQARAEDADAPPLDAVWAPPYWAPMSTGGFVSRGIDLGPSWLGLLTEEETKTFHGPGTFYGMGAQARYRLYQARSVGGDSTIGTNREFDTPTPLPEAPDFLEPGLLAEHRSVGHNQALWARNPDSVFVIHRDRLGDAGTLLLTRISGPSGKVVWDARLELTHLQTWYPGAPWIVLSGVRYRPETLEETGDPMHQSEQRMFALNLDTGEMRPFTYGPEDDPEPVIEPAAKP